MEQNGETIREITLRLNSYLDDKIHSNLKKNFSNLRHLIDSPLFIRLCHTQTSLDQLGVLFKSYDIDSDDFDIDYQTGDLKLFRDLEGSNALKQKEPKDNSRDSFITTFPHKRVDKPNEFSVQVLNNGMKVAEDDFSNRNVKKVILHRGTSPSLGLSISRHENSHENLGGIYVDDITPGGIAGKDGQIKLGDQILAINERVIDTSMTERDIIELLQKSNDAVELIISKQSIIGHNTKNESNSVSKQSKESNDQEEMVEVLPVHLVNDGTGLGFGIVRRPESGVMIKTVLPGSVAERNGRLRMGDHVLQIEDEIVKDQTTAEVANILKQSGVNVRLLIGRSYKGSSQNEKPQNVVPDNQLLEFLKTTYNHYGDKIEKNDVMATKNVINLHEIANTESGKLYCVDLVKDSGGLGLTINGYREDDESLSTCIVVSGISKHGVVDRDGRVKVGDQIVEVNGVSLKNASRTQATALLTSTGQHMRMKLLRKSSGGNLNNNVNLEGTPRPNNFNSSQLVEHELLTGKLPSHERVSVTLEKQDSNGSSDSLGTNEMIMELKNFWREIIGREYEILVAKITKNSKGSSLGITLDSRTRNPNLEVDDVGVNDENVNVEYFHILHNIFLGGPVAIEGSLRPGDRLLQVDSYSVVSVPHDEVAAIIKGLETHICMVCGRLPTKYNNNNTKDITYDLNFNKDRFEKTQQNVNNQVTSNNSPTTNNLFTSSQLGQQQQQQQHLNNNINQHRTNMQAEDNFQADDDIMNLQMDFLSMDEERQQTTFSSIPNTYSLKVSQPNATRELPKNENIGVGVRKNIISSADKNQNISSASPSNSFMDDSTTSQNMRNLFSTGWHSIPLFVDLSKEEQGLGFSVIDYENPDDPDDSTILIRSLAKGSPAEVDGRLKPGDKLVSVNNVHIPQTSLSAAVTIIKYAPKGPIRIGVLKPIQPIEALNGVPTNGASLEPDPLLLSPPISFSSKSISTSPTYSTSTEMMPFADDINFEDERRRGEERVITSFKPSQYSIKQNIANSSGSNKPVVTNNTAGDTNFKFSPVQDFENFATLEKDETKHEPIQKDLAKVNVLAVKKSFEQAAEQTVEQIFQKHFPDPADAVSTGQQVAQPEPRLVDVYREINESLGISIVGGGIPVNNSPGIFIRGVSDVGPAGRNGKLRSGDRILEVNGINCREASHEQVVEIIKNASNPIWFLVQNVSGAAAKCDNIELKSHQSHCEDSDDQEQKYGHLKGQVLCFDIDLGNPKMSLGLILAGNKSLDQMSTFVAAIQPGYAADMDGRIIPGDELLEINDQVLHERSHLNASYIIKSLNTSTVHIIILRNPENLDKIALNPKSPLPSPKFSKMPRHSVGAVGIGKENIPGDLEVGRDSIMKTKSVEFLVVPDCVKVNQGTSNSELVSLGSSTESVQNKITNSHGDSIEGKTGSTDNMMIKMTHTEKGSNESFMSLPKHDANIINVELLRENNGLGISIIGGIDTLLGSIVISDIYKNGAVDKDGRLKVGDIIIKVNNSSLENVSRETAMKFLKQGPSTVSLVLTRPSEELISSEGYYETITVDLNKKPGQSVGITIIGKHQDSSIYVCEILKGGLAEIDGKLKPGDEILSINKKSFKGQEAAADLLKSASGMVRLIVRRLKSNKPSNTFSGRMPGVPEKLQNRPPNADVIKVQLSRFDRGLVMFHLERDSAYFDRGSPIIIKEIKGLEVISKHFMVNDRILSINRVSTDDLSLEDAKKLIQNSLGSVTFEILRGSKQEKVTSPNLIPKPSQLNRLSNTSNIGEVGPIKIVTLHKETSGYGFSIVGGHGGPQGDLPIYVKNVYDGGVAARDGRLKRGDKLVAVNGESLDSMTHTEAVTLLKKCEGTIVLTVIE